MSQSWKKLTDEEKKKYQVLADKDKERHKKEMKNYKKSESSSSSSSDSSSDSDSDSSDDKKKKKKGRRKGKKKKKDPNAPKPATNPYMFFQNEKREQIKKDNPELKKLTDVAKKTGAIWRAMTEEEKKPYKEQAAKDKKRFETEKAEYEKNKKEKS